MKKLLLASFSAAALTLVGCGAEDKITETQKTQATTADFSANLQGTVYNAVTGQRVTDESLKIVLVQGSKYRQAKVRRGEKDYAGDYTLGGIPVSVSGARDYRVEVTAEGYQNFTSFVGFDVDPDGDNTEVFDQYSNFIGNIYLYPNDAVAQDIDLLVEFSGKPAAGVEVALYPFNKPTTISTATSGSNLGNSAVGSTTLTATTDASGKVSFSAADNKLVLGATYQVRIKATTVNGVKTRTYNTTLQLGNYDSTVAINLSSADDIVGTSELYITSSNSFNQDVSGDAIDADAAKGILKLTFNRPVVLVGADDINASLNGANIQTASLEGGNGSTDAATAALSADGLTLTLTAVFAAGQGPVQEAADGSNSSVADDGLRVTFDDVLLRFPGTNISDIYQLENLVGIDGNSSHNRIYVTTYAYSSTGVSL